MQLSFDASSRWACCCAAALRTRARLLLDLTTNIVDIFPISFRAASEQEILRIMPSQNTMDLLNSVALPNLSAHYCPQSRVDLLEI